MARIRPGSTEVGKPNLLQAGEGNPP